MTINRQGNVLSLDGSLTIEDSWELKQALVELKAENGTSLDLSRLEGIDLSIVQLLLCFILEADVSINPPAQEELCSILGAMGVLKC